MNFQHSSELIYCNILDGIANISAGSLELRAKISELYFSESIFIID